MAYIDLKRETIIRRVDKASRQKNDGKLSPKQIAEAINRPDTEDTKDLSDSLVGEGILFRHSEQRYIPRSFFFENAQIRIRPTKEELERGILIPGHRFLPLYDPALLPLHLSARTDGRKISTAQATMSLESLKIYYSFFGARDFLDHIASESDHNARVISENHDAYFSLVSITVLDMADLYERWDVQEGDDLLASIQSWQKGIFELFPGGKEPKDKKELKTWVSDLDKGFERLFTEMPWPLPSDEELARAVYRAGRKVVKNPPLHFGGYLNRSSLVGFVQIEGDTYLWKKNEEISPDAQARAGMKEPVLKDSYFEELIHQYELPIPFPYIEASVRNYIEMEKTFSELVYTVFAGLALDISDSMWNHLIHALDHYIDTVYSRVETFPQDERTQQIRGNLIYLHREIFEWFIRMEDYFGSLDSITSDTLKEVLDIAFMSSDVLHLLNVSRVSPTDESKTALENYYEELESTFRKKSEEIFTELREEELRNRREERIEYSKAVEYIEVEVDLEDLDPPVSRRLRIPGTMNLQDLHYVLQKSFDWDDYHLHSFYINETEYTDLDTYEPDFADEKEPHDERSLFVEDIPDLGGELLYIYDYGDDWRHHITVQKVVSTEDIPQESRETAVCLEARGAAPPEDSGGPIGYQELVEAVQTPFENRTSKQTELVYWSAGWDPEDFSKDTINFLLKEI